MSQSDYPAADISIATSSLYLTLSAVLPNYLLLYLTLICDFWLSRYPRINQALTNSPHLYLTLLLNSPRVNIPPLSVTITLSGLRISSHLYMSLLLRFLSHLNMELLLHIRGSIPTLPCYTLTCYFLSSLVTA